MLALSFAKSGPSGSVEARLFDDKNDCTLQQNAENVLYTFVAALTTLTRRISLR